MRTTALILVANLALGGLASASARYADSPPSDMRDVALRAMSDFNAERLDAAAAGFQSIADQHPDSVYAWRNLGQVRMQQGDLAGACHALKHAVTLDSHDEISQADLGFCLFQRRRFAEAIGPLERAEALAPGNSNLHAMLARCYAQTDRFEEARAESQTENVERIEMFR